MQALPGFRDFYPRRLRPRAIISSSAGATWARRYGFVEVDGSHGSKPIDLYRKKSGGELLGQLFNFTDKGGARSRPCVRK